MTPPKLYTLPLALTYLAEATNRLWAESDLLEAARMRNHPQLQALPNKDSPVDVELYAAGSPQEAISHAVSSWEMAILDKKRIEQLIEHGITSVKDAFGHDELIHTEPHEDSNPLNYPWGEYRQSKQFSQPVLVTIEMLRVPKALLDKFVKNQTTWPATPAPVKEIPQLILAKAIPKLQLQEDEILKCLKHLGYTPNSLPKPPSGKPGVKNKVWLELKSNTSTFTVSAFDKAWERLRKAGSIKDNP